MFQKLNTLKRNVLQDTIVILNYFCLRHFLVNLLERDGKMEHLIHDLWTMRDLNGALEQLFRFINFEIITNETLKWIAKNCEDLI